MTARVMAHRIDATFTTVRRRNPKLTNIEIDDGDEEDKEFDTDQE